MGEYRQAAQAFQKSYEYVNDQKALESCLYCLKLSGRTEEYQKRIQELGVTREQQTSWRHSMRRHSDRVWTAESAVWCEGYGG